MNKSDVIQDVTGASGLSKSDVEKVIDAFFDTVRAAVGQGDRVAWPSFGSFSATQRQARIGRNPRTGEPVPIAAATAVKFSASTVLKAALNPKPAKGAKKGAKAGPAKKSSTAAKSTAAKKVTAAPATKATAAPAKKDTAAPAKKVTAAPAKKDTAAPARKSAPAAKAAPASKAATKAPAKKAKKK